MPAPNFENRSQLIKRETGTIYSRQELLDVFELVNPAKNGRSWKERINASLSINTDEATIKKLHEAIIFITGSVPTFKRHNNKLVVQAVGYYSAIGA